MQHSPFFYYFWEAMGGSLILGALFVALIPGPIPILAGYVLIALLWFSPMIRDASWGLILVVFFFPPAFGAFIGWTVGAGIGWAIRGGFRNAR
jgi:hypothetical protein